MEPGRPALAAQDLRDTVRVGSVEVDRAPVTNERYAAFVRDTGHRPPKYWPGGAYPRSLARHPVVGVDFFDAIAFALWAGGALPTELEWVEATGLPEHRTYAWGDRWDKTFLNAAPSGIKGTSPVGAHPQGTAPSGCVDMCGNVWEMTCSTHPGDDESIIVKGGSWYDSPEHAQIDARFRVRVTKRINTVGFRLIYGRPPRFPEFLDQRVAARGIGQRQASEDATPATELDEFQVAFAELQAELRNRVAELDLSAFGSRVDAVDEALAMLDQSGGRTTGIAASVPKAAPAETSRSSWGRLKAGLRHLRAADFWSRLVPAYRALRSHRPERTMWQRARAAWNALRHAHKGVRLQHAVRALRASSRERTLTTRLHGALRTLWRPRGGPRLWPCLRAAVAELELSRALRAGLASVTSMVARRPRLVIVSLIVAIGAVAFVVVTTVIELPWLQRTGGTETAEIPLPAEAPPTETAWPEAPAAPFTPGASRIDDALSEIAEGGPERREGAERYLISRRDSSYARVNSALKADLAPAARASLRYVLAAIEELRSGRSTRAQLVPDPPRRGLLVFCRRFGPRTVEAIHAARRTGKAEALPVTVILVKGNERTMSAHARHLRNARVFLDRRGYLAQRLRVTHTPAVVGLDRDGRRRFLLTDPVSRARLAYEVARLKR
ncbi:MAG: formylglycine-generating enzyme family protein [Planctomycetota bacterium]